MTNANTSNDINIPTRFWKKLGMMLYLSSASFTCITKTKQIKQNKNKTKKQNKKKKKPEWSKADQACSQAYFWSCYFSFLNTYQNYWMQNYIFYALRVSTIPSRAHAMVMSQQSQCNRFTNILLKFYTCCFLLFFYSSETCLSCKSWRIRR